MPSKFSASFTIGSINIIISIALLKGPVKFLKSLFSKEKIIFTISYISTIIGTIYYSIINQNYIFVLISVSA